MVDYLSALGVSAVELLPVHAFVHDRHLIERGLRNYWGYNTIGFFAPHPEYLGKGGLGEVKTFVQVMHEAGLEVILDVVYNHTAEGSHMGPTLSFRGIDNRSYYYLMGGQERYYNDFTGTGNALELRHPYVLRMVTDSLRYWVEEMRVDGFRFDLATTLARVEGPYDQHASFLDAVAQDPVLSSVKLIAEPWDTGLGGYQVGNFPPGWAEWNGRYRDTVRRFWKGEEGQIAEMASRVSGSADIYNHRGRRPWASVNFITAHDGFTLRDLVSYDAKHNEANKEDNRDGADDNHSWNCGVEGDIDDPEIRALRRRQMRNLLTTLLLSQGVPMLLAGDEFARTQGGNNNPYCQDSEIGWLDWSLDEEGEALLAFTRRLIALRSQHIVFHRSRFFSGGTIPGTEVKDVTWLRADGREMTAADWGEAHAKMLCLLLSGEAGLMHLTARGEQEPDDTFLLVMNASHLEVGQRLPAGQRRRALAGSGRHGARAGRGSGPGRRAGRGDPARAALDHAAGATRRGVSGARRAAGERAGRLDGEGEDTAARSACWSPALPAAAQEQGDPAAGHELASKLCTVCHIIGSEPVGSDVAPPFPVLAKDPGVTLTELARLERTDAPRAPEPRVDPAADRRRQRLSRQPARRRRAAGAAQGRHRGAAARARGRAAREARRADRGRAGVSAAPGLSRRAGRCRPRGSSSPGSRRPPRDGRRGRRSSRSSRPRTRPARA